MTWIFLWDTAPSKIFIWDTQVSKVFVWDTQVRPTTPTHLFQYSYDFTTGSKSDFESTWWSTTSNFGISIWDWLYSTGYWDNQSYWVDCYSINGTLNANLQNALSNASRVTITMEITTWSPWDYAFALKDSGNGQYATIYWWYGNIQVQVWNINGSYNWIQNENGPLSWTNTIILDADLTNSILYYTYGNNSGSCQIEASHITSLKNNPTRMFISKNRYGGYIRTIDITID